MHEIVVSFSKGKITVACTCGQRIGHLPREHEAHLRELHEEHAVRAMAVTWRDKVRKQFGYV